MWDKSVASGTAGYIRSCPAGFGMIDYGPWIIDVFMLYHAHSRHGRGTPTPSLRACCVTHFTVLLRSRIHTIYLQTCFHNFWAMTSLHPRSLQLVWFFRKHGWVCKQGHLNWWYSCSSSLHQRSCMSHFKNQGMNLCYIVDHLNCIIHTNLYLLYDYDPKPVSKMPYNC